MKKHYLFTLRFYNFGIMYSLIVQNNGDSWSFRKKRKVFAILLVIPFEQRWVLLLKKNKSRSLKDTSSQV